MKIVFIFNCLLFYNFGQGQETLKVKYIDSIVSRIDSNINESKIVVYRSADNKDYYIIDTFHRELLKVISNNAPAPGQTVSYYFHKEKFLKAEVRQELDGLVQFIEHNYFDKKKQLLQKVESSEDIAFVSWYDKLFLKKAKAYLKSSKDYLGRNLVVRK
jgi:hypothetical protein